MRTISLNIEINSIKRNAITYELFDENELRQNMICDDEEHVERRVEDAIEWFGRKQGYVIRWSAWEYHTKIISGEWGYDGDDYAKPPTVGNEVI